MTALDLDSIKARAEAATPRTFWDAMSFDVSLLHASVADIPALVAEVEALRAENETLGDLALTHQTCPQRRHHDWWAPTEYAHACPWCERDALSARIEAALAQCVLADKNGEGWLTSRLVRAALSPQEGSAP